MKIGDLNWTLTPLCSFLFALGGWHTKGIRRIGIPLAIVIYAFLYYRAEVKKNYLWYAVSFLAMFAVLTLPLTYFGDSMNLRNVAWAFLVGYLNLIVLYPITQIKKIPFQKTDDREVRLFYLSYIGAIIYGVSILASFSFNSFEHKWTEIIAGLLIGFVASSIIEKE